MSDTPRLRTHPKDRLAAPVQHIDLPATIATLRKEPHAAVAGHRQIAVFRSGPVTVLAFAFEPGGVLKEHQADGVVTIQTLSGHLHVTAENAGFDVPAGHVIALAPSVQHSVSAAVESTMLLTVCLESGSTGRAD
ncbi:MAG: hypothetical protein MNPFHGCM_00004 [Gemmatimonadaceae bacterium]|nr:hypothetical protein [Gemmatimonadaceae bacterium]